MPAFAGMTGGEPAYLFGGLEKIDCLLEDPRFFEPLNCFIVQLQ
jgi:hypothetical protein